MTSRSPFDSRNCWTGSLPRVRIEKWQALGNDYLIVEREALPWELTPSRVRKLCDRNFGAGSDGILVLAPATDSRCGAELRIFNPDGSEAELSGNGAREAILYLRRKGRTGNGAFTIGTAAGPVTATVLGDRTCSVAMGRAALCSSEYPSGPADGRGRIEAAGRTWDFRHVQVGNPQCAIEVTDGLEDLDLETIGPEIERHPDFPNRTNVSFYRAEGSHVRARIFERGVGATLSSGTGACGAAVAAHLDGTGSPITVELDGGELEVSVGRDLELTLTGWALPVYTAELSGELLRELETIRE